MPSWAALVVVGVVVVGAMGYGGYRLVSSRPHVTVGSSAQQCASRPAKLATLYSDGQTTMIRLSNPDYTDMSILRTEPANVLPGMFESLMALSGDSSKLAYVTATDEGLDNAHIKLLDTANPASATDLAVVPKGLWTTTPAWSGDGKKLAFVRLDASTSPADFQLWVADNSTQPATVAEQTDLVADNFTNGHSASICWTSDNRVVLIPSVPQGLPSPSPVRASAPPPASASPATGSVCGVPTFSQNDPAWQAAVMKSGADTIGGAGCALTSTAMLLNYYGTSLSPAALNTCLGGSADPIDWKAVPACTSNVVTGGDRIDFTWTDLDALLASGRPAIVGMLRGLTGSHFVVVTSGGGGLAQNYRITDPWDATTYKTLGSYVAAGYVPTWIISYSGPGHNCGRLIKGVAPVVTGVHDGGTGTGPVTVHFGIDLSKILLAQWVLINGGAIDPGTIKVPFDPQKLTDGMTFSNEGTYQLTVVLKGQPPVVQVETFTIDHSAPVVDLSLLNPRSFGAIDMRFPGGASVVSSKYPGVDKPGRVQVTSGDTLSGVKTIQTSLDGGSMKGYSNDNLFNPVLVVNQSGDHSLRIVSTDAAGNVKDVTKYFTVFGAPTTPSPTPKTSSPSAPRVTSVVPNCGYVGGQQAVTINGSGFNGLTQVLFGTGAATVRTHTSSQIVVLSPASRSATTVDVRVTTTVGTSSITSADRYTYTGVVVGSLSPTSAPAGTVITITMAAGFPDSQFSTPVVYFGTAQAKYSDQSGNKIFVFVPSVAPGTYDVIVRDLNGTSCVNRPADQFKVT